MMMLLFIATVFLSFSQIKDAIFLIDQWKPPTGSTIL